MKRAIHSIIILAACVMFFVSSQAVAAGIDAGAEDADICANVNPIDISGRWGETTFRCVLENYNNAGICGNGIGNLLVTQGQKQAYCIKFQIVGNAATESSFILTAKDNKEVRIQGIKYTYIGGSDFLKVAREANFTPNILIKDSVITCRTNKERGVGIYIEADNVTVRNADISNCAVGIKLGGSLEDNSMIMASNVVIGADGEDDYADNKCRLHDNGRGLYVMRDGVGNKFGFNDIYDNYINNSSGSADSGISIDTTCLDPDCFRPKLVVDGENSVKCYKNEAGEILKREIMFSNIPANGKVAVYGTDNWGQGEFLSFSCDAGPEKACVIPEKIKVRASDDGEFAFPKSECIPQELGDFFITALFTGEETMKYVIHRSPLAGTASIILPPESPPVVVPNDREVYIDGAGASEFGSGGSGGESGGGSGGGSDLGGSIGATIKACSYSGSSGVLAVDIMETWWWIFPLFATLFVLRSVSRAVPERRRIVHSRRRGQ